MADYILNWRDAIQSLASALASVAAVVHQADMAAVPLLLYHGYADDGSALLYTVPEECTAVVQEIALTNSSGADVSVSVFLVPPDQAAGTGEDAAYHSLVLAAGESFVAARNSSLQAGWSVSVVADTPNAVACHISGTVRTDG